MPHRFYCAPLAESGLVTLADTEFHHLAHVLRQQVNESVELFDGHGLVATARIAEIRKREAILEILSSEQIPAPKVELILATAVPKGDRFEWLVEKATELGVSRLIPITTVRSVVDPRASKLDKLRQTVIAACKQSGRSHLMVISPVTGWNDFLQEFARRTEILVAHPGGDRWGALKEMDATQRESDESAGGKSPVVAIGPEGGFTDAEIGEAIELGARTVRLGSLILRIETAAIALAAKILL
jgi:16S rRNA (uracil1498-N3)-methyltransferase